MSEQKLMKAIYMAGPKNVYYGNAPIPEPDPGEVRVKVMATGVCGGELRIYLGKQDPREKLAFDINKPRIPGHEYAGIVDRIGAGVTGVHIGDRVAICPTKYCGECPECKAGKYNICKLRKVPKPGDGHSQGGNAEYACIRARNLIPLADNVTFTQGAMIEPCAVSMHLANRAGNISGKTVAIMGMGSLGFYLLEYLKLKDVKNIIAIDIVDDKLEMAKAHGADYIYNSKIPADELAAHIHEEAGPIDVVFECVVIQPTIDLSIKLVCGGGSIVAAGLGAYELRFVWRNLIDNEINIVPSIIYTTEMHDCAKLLADGKLDIDYIASVFPMEEAVQRFKDMEKNSPYIKMVFIPNHPE